MEFNFFCVDVEDFETAVEVWEVDDDLAVEAAWSEEGCVEDIWAVGGCDDDDAFVRVEAVHFDEEGVEGLFTFVVTAAEACAALSADGVDFVDEEDARGIFSALFEHIADAGGADADEHFYEVRARDGEERDISFTCYGSGEEGFTGTWSADHEDTFRDFSADFLEFFGIFEEFDDFLNFFFGFLAAGYVFESGVFGVLGEEFGTAFTEGHGAFAGHADLSGEEEVEEADD